MNSKHKKSILDLQNKSEPFSEINLCVTSNDWTKALLYVSELGPGYRESAPTNLLFGAEKEQETRIQAKCKMLLAMPIWHAFLCQVRRVQPLSIFQTRRVWWPTGFLTQPVFVLS